MTKLKACKNCRALVQGDVCEICGGKDFITSWKGRIIVLNAQESEIAKQLKITKEGSYAIKTK